MTYSFDPAHYSGKTLLYFNSVIQHLFYFVHDVDGVEERREECVLMLRGERMGSFLLTLSPAREPTLKSSLGNSELHATSPSTL